MRKVRLDVTTLKVESFASEGPRPARGTVVGHWSFVNTECGNTVWEAGCSEVTAALDCATTEGGYTNCQSLHQACTSTISDPQ